MAFSRLPPEYRRRAVINIAILTSVVLGLANVGRLGPTNGARAIVIAFTLLFAYLIGFCGYRFARAAPRPGAFILYAVLLCVMLIAYRNIISPQLGERFRTIRTAQREAQASQLSKDEFRGMFVRKDDDAGR